MFFVVFCYFYFYLHLLLDNENEYLISFEAALNPYPVWISESELHRLHFARENNSLFGCYNLSMKSLYSHIS